jgi:hypothetical protein
MDAPPNYTEAVRLAVIRAMDTAGTNRERLCAATGMSRTETLRKLQGLKPFNVTELDLIAGFLGIDVETFTMRGRAA